MSLAELKDWTDVISKLALPFVLAWLGFVVTRLIETRKAGVARSSNFKTKWADSFFETSHEFMKSTERYMSILNQIQGMKDLANPFGRALHEELNELNIKLGELQLRINRLAYFAPLKGRVAIEASKAIQDYLVKMVAQMKGSFDHLISLQNGFNLAVQDAHAEMLDIQ
jgi:hypothetical protein